MSRAIVCPSCRQLISSAEARCPYCGAVAPAASAASFFRKVEFTEVITYACGALFVLSLALDPREALSGSLFAIGSPTHKSLALLGMTSPAAPPWTVISSVFLHGSLLHIFFNLSWVRSLLPLTTELFGPARAWVLFWLSGVCGMVASNQLLGAPTIGASGAIFGLQGALWVWGRRRGGTLGRSLSAQVLGWIVGGLVIGCALPGVNNVAHIGGLLTGVAAGALMARHPMEGRTVQFLGVACAVLSVLSVLASVGVGLK